MTLVTLSVGVVRLEKTSNGLFLAVGDRYYRAEDLSLCSEDQAKVERAFAAIEKE